MRTHGRAIGGVVLAALLAGCGSTSGTAGTTSPTQGSSSAPTSVPASASAHPASSGAASVDLTLSGTVNVIAKGSAGRCILFTRPDGSVSFGFEMTDADYPGIGQSFSLANFSGTYVDVKWLVDDTTAYTDDPKAPLTLSADHHTVELHGNLVGMTPTGGSPAGPETADGRITCP